MLANAIALYRIARNLKLHPRVVRTGAPRTCRPWSGWHHAGGTKPKGDVSLQPRLLFASSLHNPLCPALYRSARGGVKKHSRFLAVKAVAWYDLQSRKKGERPVGVPAARGHGVMEV